MEFDAALSQVLSALGSCRDALANQLLPAEDAVSPDEIRSNDGEAMVWVRAHNPNDVDKELMGGLELLVLLAYVDWKVWIKQVKKIWPSSSMIDYGSKPRRVGIELSVDFGSGMVGACEWLGSSPQPCFQSRECREATALTHKLLKVQGKVVTHVPVRLKGEMRLNTGPALNQLMQLVLTQRYFDALLGGHGNQTGHSGSSYRGLRVQCVHAGLVAFTSPSGLRSTVLSASSLQSLSTIVENGVAIDSLGIIDDSTHHDCPRLLVQSLWTLLAIGETDGDASRCGVKYASIVPLASMGMIAAVLSGFQASRSLRAVVVERAFFNPVTDRTHRLAAWKWISWALFAGTPSGRNRLQHVSWSVGDFDDDALEQIEEVVSASDPVGVLTGRSRVLATVSVSASRFYLSDPTGKATGDVPSVVCDEVLQELPVLKRSAVWTTVLLPGWGEAWLHRDDIAATHTDRVGPFDVQAIPHVTLTDVTERSRTPVMGLLRLIGSGVRHLSFQGMRLYHSERGTPPVDYWIDELFEACPRLERLELMNFNISSLQFLLDGYASGTCRLISFKASHRSVTTLDDSVRRLFVALADKHHPASRHLQEFAFYPVTIRDLMAVEFQSAVLTMLEQNQAFAGLDLRFNANDPDRRLMKPCVEPFVAFHGDLIPCPRTPRDIQQRLAFLSVMCPQPGGRVTRSSREGRAIDSLDADALSLIFRMASSRKQRQVYVGVLSGR